MGRIHYMEAPNLNPSNVAVAVALIGIFGQVLAKWLETQFAKKRSLEQNAKAARTWRIVLLVLGLAAVTSVVVLYSQTRQSANVREQLNVQLASEREQKKLMRRELEAAFGNKVKGGLSASLEGSYRYILNDFHWPVKPPLDVMAVHGSIKTQRQILEDALERFIIQIELVSAVVGPEGRSVCTEAINYSNEITAKILAPLKRGPSTDQAELIQLKRDLLVAFETLLRVTDPQQ